MSKQAEPQRGPNFVQTREERLRKLLSRDVRLRVDGEVSDLWARMGSPKNAQPGGLDRHIRFQNIPADHIDAISERLLEKGGCEAMILGPGRGDDIPLMVDEVRKNLTARGAEGSLDNLRIDVFGLTKKLKEKAAAVVRDDYSSADKPVPFEFYENPSLVGRYDVVVDLYGVAAKSHYPHHIIAKEADMLAPGGVAYVEANLGHGTYAGLDAEGKIDHVKKLCEGFWAQKRKDRRYRMTHTRPADRKEDWFIVEREA